jgi:hypothetical protein
MPAQPRDPSADQPTQGHTHTADHEIFDEDSLREDQPYANLEDDPDATRGPDTSEPEGADAW